MESNDSVYELLDCLVLDEHRSASFEQLCLSLKRVISRCQTSISSNQEISAKSLLILNTLIKCVHQIQQDFIEEEKSYLENVTADILRNICTYTLRLITSTKVEQKVDKSAICSALCALISSSLEVLWSVKTVNLFFPVFSELLYDANAVLSSFGVDANRSHQLDTLLRILSTLVDSWKLTAVKINDNQEFKVWSLLQRTLVSLLMHDDLELMNQLLCTVFPKLLDIHEDRTALLKLLENTVELSYKTDDSGEITQLQTNGLSILCWMVDKYLLTDEYKPDNPFFTSALFWKILQHGLLQNYCRKRALYIVSRIVVWCQSNPRNSSLFDCEYFHIKAGTSWWEHIIGLLEVLEEKQVHLIKPLLGWISLLVKNVKDDATHCHISWLLVLFCRMLQHQSKYVKKWAVQTVLELNIGEFQHGQEHFQKFITHNLLESLDDPALFTRSINEPLKSCPLIATSLRNFMHMCYLALPDPIHKEIFFKEFVESMQHISWSGIGLLYVTYALSELPKTPLWDSQTLENLREILVLAIQTQDVFLRVGIQCLTVKSVLNLTKLDDVSVEVFIKFLSMCQADESFSRGTAQWQGVVTFLRTLASEPVLDNTLCISGFAQFCGNTIDALLNSPCEGRNTDTQNVAARQECHHLALTLFLLADADLIASNMNEAALLKWAELLDPFIDILVSACSRPYLSVFKIQNSFCFMLCLIKYCKTEDSKNCAVIEILYQHMEIILNSTTIKLLSAESMDEAEVFLDFITGLETIGKLQNIVLKHVFSILNSLIGRLNVEMHSKMFHHFVAWTCLFLLTKECWGNSDKNGSDEGIRNVISAFLEDWIRGGMSLQSQVCSGKLGCRIIATSWDCVAIYLAFLEALDVQKAMKITLLAQEQLQCACGTAIRSILASLERPFPLLSKAHPDVISRTLSLAWNACMELKKNELFKPTLQVFVKVAYQPELMEIMPDCLRKYTLLFHSQGEMATGVFNILVAHCFKMWNTENFFPTLHKNLDILTLSLTFGPVHKKNQRVNYDAAAFLSQQDDLAVNTLVKSDHQDNIMVRVYPLHFLCHLAPEEPSHQSLAKLTMDALVKEDERVSSLSASHFHNSEIHRIKQRIWQSLLIMQPVLSKKALSILLDVVLNILATTNQQPSVRYLQEWLVVQILRSDCNLWEHFRNIFFKSSEKRVGSICSFLAIVVHLANCLPPETLPEFITFWFPQVIRCCMLQNFNSRVYAQVALSKLWDLCVQHNLDELLDKFSIIKPSLQVNMNDGNTSKNIQKLLKDFYFYTFHPQQHFTMQTIFYELPRLSGVTDEEWIPPSLFAKLLKAFNTLPGSMNLNNADDVLEKAEPGSWVLRATGLKEQDSSTLDMETFNFQKKITPWKHVLPELTQDIENTRKGKPAGDLIVVASLISRPPNLGGLCRTCEIFGVNEYVIGSLKYIEDQQFQNLSVSSEHWVSIREVKPFNLKEYLLEQKDAGYCIIGLEQAADSEKLNEFTFPKKSVLLLGNEKEGLPADFLNFLDVCLEIPQQGVTRSLNVHVSGAICIWEYACQHLIQ